MDEKTEELRDIFMSVSETETVTERQEDDRGSLADDQRDRDRLESVIAAMRERYDFDTPLSDDDLCRIARRFFDDESDDQIADALDTDPHEIFVARTDLHLTRESEYDPPDLPDDLRQQLLADDTDLAAFATEHDTDPDTLSRHRRAITSRNRELRANHRYRDQFAELLADTDLSQRMADEVREDGLDDATDGMETNVSF